MNANHRPPKFAPTKKRRGPSRIKMNATACPTRAASFVECSALPVTHHASARNTRPPSSENIAIMLMRAGAGLLYRIQSDGAITGVDCPLAESRHDELET